MGFWSDLGDAVGDAFASLGNQLLNFLQELGNRALGALDFVLTLLGIMFPKKIRISVVILRDDTGPLAIASNIEGVVRQASDIFEREVNTKIVAASGGLVRTESLEAPSYVLDVHCNGGAWTEELGDAGAYFRNRIASSLWGSILGFAAPLTVFIVRTIEGEGGCSLGIFTDYVTLERELIPLMGDDVSGTPPHSVGSADFRTMAHEIAHGCGLLHPPWFGGGDDNLMNPDGEDTDLNNFQKAIFRNSRHVTFL